MGAPQETAQQETAPQETVQTPPHLEAQGPACPRRTPLRNGPPGTRQSHPWPTIFLPVASRRCYAQLRTLDGR